MEYSVMDDLDIVQDIKQQTTSIDSKHILEKRAITGYKLGIKQLLVCKNRQIRNKKSERSTLNIEQLMKAEKERKEQEKIFCIDRFEGNLAVCEDRNTREMLNIEKDNLPENVQEGDVLKYKNGKYILDEEIKKEIEERIKNKLINLFED